MGLKLFVDDLRRCPEGWTPARTITEAIRILSTQDVEEVSLDHDICCQPAVGDNHSSWETFEPVAWFLLMANSPIEIIKVRIHTANTTAGQRMAQIMAIDYNNEIYDEANYVVDSSSQLKPGGDNGNIGSDSTTETST